MERQPYIDETEEEFIVTAFMPGVKYGEIRVKTAERAVHISAEGMLRNPYPKKDAPQFLGETGYEYLLQLPDTADLSGMSSLYFMGWLEIRIPKRAQQH